MKSQTMVLLLGTAVIGGALLYSTTQDAKAEPKPDAPDADADADGPDAPEMKLPDPPEPREPTPEAGPVAELPPADPTIAQTMADVLAQFGCSPPADTIVDLQRAAGLDTTGVFDVRTLGWMFVSGIVNLPLCVYSNLNPVINQLEMAWKAGKAVLP